MRTWLFASRGSPRARLGPEALDGGSEIGDPGAASRGGQHVETSARQRSHVHEGAQPLLPEEELLEVGGDARLRAAGPRETPRQSRRVAPQPQQRGKAGHGAHPGLALEGRGEAIEAGQERGVENGAAGVVIQRLKEVSPETSRSKARVSWYSGSPGST